MKKSILVIATVVLAFANNASAQFIDKVTVGAYGGLGIPVGDMSTVKYKMGFGGGVSGRYFINDNMAAGLNIGYYTFTNETSSDMTFSFMPVNLAFDYYFMTEGLKPYAGIELGTSRVSEKVTVPILGTVETTENDFGFGVVAGAAYELNDMLDVFANVKYSYVSTTGKAATYIPINVGITYKFGK